MWSARLGFARIGAPGQVVLGVTGLLFLLLGQMTLRLLPLTWASPLLALAGLGLLLPIIFLTADSGWHGAAAGSGVVRPRFLPPFTLGILVLLIAAIVVAGVLLPPLGPAPLWYAVVTALWLVLLWLYLRGIGAAVPTPGQGAAWLVRGIRGAEGRVLGVVFVIAALLRFVGLEQAPRHFHGDEGVFAFAALEAIQGIAPNPFLTGWTSNPTLVYFLQGAMMRLLGDTVPGVRVLSAIGGVLGVAATYWWMRSMFGRPHAVLSAVLLTGYDAHLYFSRTALRHSWDSVWVPLTLGLFYLGVARGQRWALGAAGVSAGLAQYWYFGTRILPPILVVLFLYVAIWHRERIRPVGRAAALLLIGFGLAFLPLGVHYAVTPSALTERVRTVTSGSFYSIPATADRVGVSPVAVYLENARLTVLAFHRETPKVPFFTTGRPLLDPVSAALVLVGLGVALARSRHLAYVLLWLPWVLVIGVVSVTEFAPQAQRLFTGVVPMIGLITLGLVETWRGILTQLGVGRAGVLRASLVSAVGLSGLGVWLLFGEYLPSGRDMTGNTEVATELGYYLREQGVPVRYYFFAEPRMSTTTHPSLPFIARNATGEDVPLLPADSGVRPFHLHSGRTLFVLLPHRIGEWGPISATNGGADLIPILNQAGTPVFYVSPPFDRP